MTPRTQTILRRWHKQARVTLDKVLARPDVQTYLEKRKKQNRLQELGSGKLLPLAGIGLLAGGYGMKHLGDAAINPDDRTKVENLVSLERDLKSKPIQPNTPLDYIFPQRTMADDQAGSVGPLYDYVDRASAASGVKVYGKDVVPMIHKIKGLVGVKDKAPDPELQRTDPAEYAYQLEDANHYPAFQAGPIPAYLHQHFKITKDIAEPKKWGPNFLFSVDEKDPAPAHIKEVVEPYRVDPKLYESQMQQRMGDLLQKMHPGVTLADAPQKLTHGQQMELLHALPGYLQTVDPALATAQHVADTNLTRSQTWAAGAYPTGARVALGVMQDIPRALGYAAMGAGAGALSYWLYAKIKANRDKKLGKIPGSVTVSNTRDISKAINPVVKNAAAAIRTGLALRTRLAKRADMGFGGAPASTGASTAPGASGLPKKHMFLKRNKSPVAPASHVSDVSSVISSVGKLGGYTPPPSPTMLKVRRLVEHAMDRNVSNWWNHGGDPNLPAKSTYVRIMKKWQEQAQHDTKRAELQQRVPKFKVQSALTKTLHQRPAREVKYHATPRTMLAGGGSSVMKVAGYTGKPDKLLVFPELRQVYDYDCGACALQNILTYYGGTLREQKVLEQTGTDAKDGTSMEGLRKAVKHYGLKYEDGTMTLEKVKEYIDKDIPVMLSIQAYAGERPASWKGADDESHWVVAVGYEGDTLIFEDPAAPMRTYLDKEDLLERWYDYNNEPHYYGMAIFGRKPAFEPDLAVPLEESEDEAYGAMETLKENALPGDKNEAESASRDDKTASMVKLVPLQILSTLDELAEPDKPKAKLDAELAITPKTRRRGLSKRASVPQGRGMFFDTPGPFWMAGCMVPLDIMFMAKSGEVLDIQTMPVIKAPDRILPHYSSRKEGAAYAVETPAGWCRKQGVKPGDRVVLGGV